MAHTLIGSSNVFRHYQSKDHSACREYKLVKCTQTAGFKAYMGSLDKNRTTVLISVIENFIVDAVGADVANPESSIDECITDFLKIIEETATRLPDTRFGVVMPLRRPALKWYQDRVEQITGVMKMRAQTIMKTKPSIYIIDCISEFSQDFEPDNIHLTTASGIAFLDIILTQAETAFSAEQINITDDEDDQVGAGKYQGDLEGRLARLEEESNRQREAEFSNNLMFARIREEIDFGTNKAKEDRVVMTGLTSKTPMPAESRAKIDFLKKLAMEIFQKLIPGFEGTIMYVSQGKQTSDQLPMVEVRLEKLEHAVAIRRAFAEKRKSKDLPKDLDKLFVSNCVNLATRVRIDIMKSIARKVTGKDDLAYVAGFISRPMMHIRKAGTNQRPVKSFNFIDTINRYGRLVAKSDLESAYARAGKAFLGQMRQNFVVLHEPEQAWGPDRRPTAGTSGSNRASAKTHNRGAAGGYARGGGGLKRKGDDLESNNKK